VSENKRVGRPSKKDVSSVKKGNRNSVGRPKGDAATINEYKARMLASPKSRKVLDSILNAALDDDHKNQAAAWKLCMDRLLPVSYFEKDKAGGGRGAINISITGVGGETTVISGGEEDIEEGNYSDV
jgi:hypothetical protein|tara:strand:- start:2554 stop:2934 length:381 start_codon:yes stop_codon:yes gene_type:complete